MRRKDALRDALAGVTLASMSIPQVLGYTRIAGTPVVTGLYTLLLPAVAFAVVGSSRHLVVAADSATAAVFATGLAPMAPLATEKYMALAGMVALLTGGLLLVARALRLGFLADFFSRTVLAGFLAGVGVQVGIAVLGEMLGLKVSTHRTVLQLADILTHLAQVHLPTLAISTVLVGSILAGKRFLPRLPVPLLAVGAAIMASYAFDFAGRGMAVIGPITGGWAPLTWPDVSWSQALRLVPTAASCFLIIVAQSTATSRAAALSHHERVDADADLLGLAAANVVAGVSGAFVVNGSPTQTAMGERTGARSQLAQLSAAGVALMTVLFLTGPLQYLPRAVLAGIVFTIAIGLVDAKQLSAIRRESPGEFWLAVGTAATVALVGLEQGILVATGLSLLRHVRHSYRPHTSILAPDEAGRWQPVPAAPGRQTEPGLIVYRFGADLFYANDTRFADEVRSLMGSAPAPVRWLVVDAAAITDIDYSAAQTVRDLSAELSREGVGLVFGRVSSYLRADMDRHGITAALGTSHVFTTLHEALAFVRAAAPSVKGGGLRP